MNVKLHERFEKWKSSVKRDIKQIKEFKLKKTISIQSYFNLFFAFTVGIQSFIFLFIVITSILYAVYKSEVLILVVFILTIIVMLISSAAFVFFFKTARSLFYDNLYQTTKKNIAQLAKFRLDFEEYNKSIIEFTDLNNNLDTLHNALNQVVVTSKPLDYNNFTLEYIGDPSDCVITSKSFTKNLSNFILGARVFRNAVCFIAINLPLERIKEEYYSQIIDVCKRHIKGDKIMYAIDPSYGGVLIYYPKMDTVNYLDEALHKIVKEGAIQEFTATGVNIIKVKASYVIYPYSSLDSILPDLRYANRKGQLVNSYIPTKTRKIDKTMNHTTLLFAQLNKIYNQYNTLTLTQGGSKIAIHKAVDLMHDMRQYLGFETCGTIMYHELSDSYYSTFEDRENDDVFFMQAKNARVEKELVDDIVKSVDHDFTYYFSRRETVCDSFARTADIYGIRSGCFFVVEDDNQVIAIIYFVNKTKDAALPSKQREALVIFNTYLGIFSKSIASKRLLTASNQRSVDMMRLSDLNIYEINEDTFKITSFSDPMKDRVPTLEEGKACYEVLYGRGAPCVDCPLKTHKRMTSIINGKKYVTSVQASRNKSIIKTFVCKQIEKESNADTSRFNSDLLVFSGYALAMRIQNLYARGIRGELILIHIDNFKDLLYRYKEAGYFQCVRTFITLIEEHKEKNFDMFLYKQDTLAIILGEEDHADTTKIIENINRQSDSLRNLGDALTIRLSFLVFPFPSGFQTSVDFNRHIERYLSENILNLETNDLVFTDTGYTRKADRELFLISLLDKAIDENNLPVKLHPVYGFDDNTVVGAEMLLRFFDPHLGIPIDTTEFIDTCTKFERIGDLSIKLLDFMVAIINKYGSSTFKTTGFRYFAINTDSTFLKNESFLNTLAELMTSSAIPRGMLNFEMQEKDIFEHKDLLLSLKKRFESYNILLVCDDYTGDYLSVEDAYNLGIRHFKISRFIVLKITEDVQMLTQLKAILEDADRFDVSVCFVGVETKEHLRFLNELGYKVYKQGYYFAKPLTEEEFISELKDRNLQTK